jgi:N-acetyl-gamma-glutamyl-phosphate reductase
MNWKVYVDGQEGTTGLRIHELLARRNDIELLRIDSDRRKDVAERARLLNAADIAFLCLPDAAAREAAALVTNSRTCVIDASTAHRTATDWVFGLPELTRGQRDLLRKTKRITNPGCHATAFILLVRPLIEAGLLDPAAALTAQSITGYSGGGRKMIEQYEGAGRNDSQLKAPRPYGLSLAHKHIPEMMARTGLTRRPLFMPIVANFYKGLVVSVPLHLSSFDGASDAPSIHAALRRHYDGERFIRVWPLDDPGNLDDGYFDVQACNDTNRCDLFVFGHADQAILLARLDNLGKGASGAAVQSMNVHLGVDEGTGL